VAPRVYFWLVYSYPRMRAFPRAALFRAVAAAALAVYSDVPSATAIGLSSSAPATLISLTEGGGGALCLTFTLDGLPFRAIVDTGSPFLTVPAEADCAEQPRRQAFFGCAPTTAFREASIPPSPELYGTFEASMDWRVAELRGLTARPQLDVVFGAAPRALVEASGGTFAGLIPNGDGQHPTLLGQLSPPITGFMLDGPNLELTLYPSTPTGSKAVFYARPGLVMQPPGLSVIPGDADAVQMVDLRPLGDPVDPIASTPTGSGAGFGARRARVMPSVDRPVIPRDVDAVLMADLRHDRELSLYPSTHSGAGFGARPSGDARSLSIPVIPRGANAVQMVDLRPLGDPVDHIAATATCLLLDGNPVPLLRPLIAVFDSGLSGSLLSSTLCDDAPDATSAARLAAASSLEVVLQTESGGQQTLRATRASTPRLFRVSSQPVPWFPDPSVEPAVVVLGQAFLREAVLRVDFRERRILCIQGQGDLGVMALA
jgi:hypothetical protein